VILDDILAHKRGEVAVQRRTAPVAMLRDRPLYHAARRGFRAALAARRPPAVIAELKRASPSRGVIRTTYDVAALARGYEAGGAAALSVLTDAHFFGGALDDLARAREASHLPCLRKDFLVEPYQLDEARAWGADAVLLIAAAAGGELGRELLAAAREHGLDVLVEVHTAAELEWAMTTGATLIGVNNRDLTTFATRLETTEDLLQALQRTGPVLFVAESGIRSPADVRRMVTAGAHAVLVGEALMESSSPGETLAAWLRCP
jgi:indole-3-glycerol phosphate synthase